MTKKKRKSSRARNQTSTYFLRDKGRGGGDFKAGVDKNGKFVLNAVHKGDRDNSKIRSDGKTY